MSYSLEYDEDHVVAYLRGVALSREGRVRLFTGLNVNLGQYGDSYRSTPSRRLRSDSPYFWYEFMLLDEHGDGLIHYFRFVVSDAAAPYGVLRVVYVDEDHWPPPEGLL